MAHSTCELVTAFHSSKLTRKTFCKERSIAVSTLQYHLQKYAKDRTSAGSTSVGPRFVPIVPQLSAKRAPTIIIKGDFSLSEIVEFVKVMSS